MMMPNLLWLASGLLLFVVLNFLCNSFVSFSYGTLLSLTNLNARNYLQGDLFLTQENYDHAYAAPLIKNCLYKRLSWLPLLSHAPKFLGSYICLCTLTHIALWSSLWSRCFQLRTNLSKWYGHDSFALTLEFIKAESSCVGHSVKGSSLWV